MAKNKVDVNELMAPLLKKYNVNVELLSSDAHRKDEVLKLRDAFNEKDGFNANNLMNWCKAQGISLSAVTIAKWMDKGNSQVSPKPVKTTSASGTVKQWTQSLAGQPVEQRHTITHAEWLFITEAKNLMTEEQLTQAYANIQQKLIEDRLRAIEAEAALAMQALTGRKPDAVFLREMKEFITGDAYQGKGWCEFKREDKRRLADMAESGNEDAQEMVLMLNRESEAATKQSGENLFTPAEEQATDGAVSPSEASKE